MTSSSVCYRSQVCPADKYSYSLPVTKAACKSEQYRKTSHHYLLWEKGRCVLWTALEPHRHIGFPILVPEVQVIAVADIWEPSSIPGIVFGLDVKGVQYALVIVTFMSVSLSGFFVSKSDNVLRPALSIFPTVLIIRVYVEAALDDSLQIKRFKSSCCRRSESSVNGDA